MAYSDKVIDHYENRRLRLCFIAQSSTDNPISRVLQKHKL